MSFINSAAYSIIAVYVHFDQFGEYAIVAKQFPHGISVHTVNCCFKVEKRCCIVRSSHCSTMTRIVQPGPYMISSFGILLAGLSAECWLHLSSFRWWLSWGLFLVSTAGWFLKSFSNGFIPLKLVWIVKFHENDVLPNLPHPRSSQLNPPSSGWGGADFSVLFLEGFVGLIGRSLFLWDGGKLSYVDCWDH